MPQTHSKHQKASMIPDQKMSDGLVPSLLGNRTCISSLGLVSGVDEKLNVPSYDWYIFLRYAPEYN